MRSAIVVLGLAACGSGGGTDVAVDAVDAVDRTVLLEFTGRTDTLSYVAVRDGDDPWQQLVLDGDGHAEQRVVHGFYTYIIGCPSASGGVRQVYVVYDVAAPPAPLAVCPPGDPPTIRLTGTLAPTAATVFGGEYLGVTTNGAYSLTVRPGRYDVLATVPGRALIRRGEVVDADRTLDLDLADGFPLTAAPAAVTGATDVTLTTQLETAGGTVAELPGSATSFDLVPVAEQRPGDRQLAIVTANDPQGHRYRQHVVDGATVPPFELSPPPILYGDRLGATWGGDWERVTFQLTGEAFGEGLMIVTFTGAWAVRNHTDAVTVPWTDPDLLPGWELRARVFEHLQLLRWTAWLESGDPHGEWAVATDTGIFNW